MSEENVKRKVLSVLSVEHQGILPRVTGLFSRRGFNIDSIIACKTEDPGLARWTLVVTVFPENFRAESYELSSICSE